MSNVHGRELLSYHFQQLAGFHCETELESHPDESAAENLGICLDSETGKRSKKKNESVCLENSFYHQPFDLNIGNTLVMGNNLFHPHSPLSDVGILGITCVLRKEIQHI